MKQYYYSIEKYEEPELLAFLEDCDKRYKDLDLKIACSFTNCWLISNKDLYTPLQEGDIKYKYRGLTSKPTPERRWKVNWIDYKRKLAILREILRKSEYGIEQISKEGKRVLAHSPGLGFETYGVAKKKADSLEYIYGRGCRVIHYNYDGSGIYNIKQESDFKEHIEV